MAELQGDTNAAIKELRKQTNEVEGVLKNNVEKLVEREGNLNDLEVKAQNLEEGTVIQIKISNRKLFGNTKVYFWSPLSCPFIGSNHFGHVQLVLDRSDLIWTNTNHFGVTSMFPILGTNLWYVVCNLLYDSF